MKDKKFAIFLTLTSLYTIEALVHYNMGENHASGKNDIRHLKIKIPPKNEMAKVMLTILTFSLIGTVVVNYVIK